MNPSNPDEPDLGWRWLLLVLALYLPFLGRAWHLDDGFLMMHARAVLEDPWNPYHGRFDFIGRSWSRHFYTHPPLLWYVLAPVAALPRAWQEPAAHLLMLPFLLLLFPALRWLGSFGPDRLGRAFLLTSPLLIVLAHGVAWEMPILACHLATAGLMVQGARTKSLRTFLAAALPASIALMLAYPGKIILLIPILGFLLKVTWSWSVAVILLALIPLGLFELGTAILWGQSHFALVMTSPLTAFSYSVLRQDWLPGRISLLAEIGCLPIAAPLLVLVPRMPLLAALSLLGGGLIAGLVPLDGPSMRLQMTVWCVLGGFALGLVLRESLVLLRQAWSLGPRSLGAPAFWAAWFWMEVGYCATGIVHGSARYALPMLPSLAFFVGRAWQRSAWTERGFRLALAVNLVFAVGLSLADFEEVRAYARAPQAIQQLPRLEGRSYYVGAWGFHASMDEAGHHYLHHIDWLWPGDRIVRPRQLTSELNVLNAHLLDGVEPVLTHSLVLPSRVPLRLNERSSGAGFWWSGTGLLPVGFTRAPVDEIEVYTIQPLGSLLQAVQRLPEAPLDAGQGAKPHLVFSRFGDGVPRAALFLHPPASVIFELGPGSGILRLGSGIHPDAGPGDGAEVQVFWEGREILRQAAGLSAWSSTEVPFQAPGPGRLVVRADPGPAGNPAHDWLCIRLDWGGPTGPPVLGARWSAQGLLLQ